MSFLIRTEPLLQKTIGKEDYHIVAIAGSTFDMDITLSPTGRTGTFAFHFYNEFQALVYSINVSRQDIVNKIKSKLIEQNVPDVDITSEVLADNIYRDMYADSLKVRFAAMSQFAANYGLTLLPIEQQNGKFESVEEEQSSNTSI